MIAVRGQGAFLIEEEDEDEKGGSGTQPYSGDFIARCSWSSSIKRSRTVKLKLLGVTVAKIGRGSWVEAYRSRKTRT
jgi:hypothetical protein